MPAKAHAGKKGGTPKNASVLNGSTKQMEQTLSSSVVSEPPPQRVIRVPQTTQSWQRKDSDPALQGSNSGTQPPAVVAQSRRGSATQPPPANGARNQTPASPSKAAKPTTAAQPTADIAGASNSGSTLAARTPQPPILGLQAGIASHALVPVGLTPRTPNLVKKKMPHQANGRPVSPAAQVSPQNGTDGREKTPHTVEKDNIYESKPSTRPMTTPPPVLTAGTPNTTPLRSSPPPVSSASTAPYQPPPPQQQQQQQQEPTEKKPLGTPRIIKSNPSPQRNRVAPPQDTQPTITPAVSATMAPTPASPAREVSSSASKRPSPAPQPTPSPAPASQTSAPSPIVFAHPPSASSSQPTSPAKPAVAKAPEKSSVRASIIEAQPSSSAFRKERTRSKDKKKVKTTGNVKVIHIPGDQANAYDVWNVYAPVRYVTKKQQRQLIQKQKGREEHLHKCCAFMFQAQASGSTTVRTGRRPSTEDVLNAGYGKDHIACVCFVMSLYPSFPITRRPLISVPVERAFERLYKGSMICVFKDACSVPTLCWSALRLLHNLESDEGSIAIYNLSDEVTLDGYVPLSYLTSVSHGLEAPEKRSFVGANGTITCAKSGGVRQEVSEERAFTLHCEGEQKFYVSFVALEDKDLECWLSVCEYFAKLNAEYLLFTESQPTQSTPTPTPPPITV